VRLKLACEVHSSRRIRLAGRTRGGLSPSTMLVMTYEEFISRVAESVGVSEDEAVKLTRAVLKTLAERITGGEARDLAEQLPVQLQTPLLPAREEAEGFSIEEFIRRTEERAGVDWNTAEIAVDAVLATLRDAVDPTEFDHVLSQLPEPLKRLGTPKIT
jgi:uncharacterized protein (DUF2267 family)